MIHEPVVTLGLMSGTSLDGVDAALLETNGEVITDLGASATQPYPDDFRRRLAKEVTEAGKLDRPTSDTALIDDLTLIHVEAVRNLLNKVPADSKWAKPRFIGFHGHTTLHRPERGYTQQIGNAHLLADRLSTPVVSDFRTADVLKGGEGAPLAPIFHAAMMQEQRKPVTVVNVGGISNVTWIGQGQDDLVAFDTGPGNGLMDAWVEERTGARYDDGGRLAANGSVATSILDGELSRPYFQKDWPKSLDRSDFTLAPFAQLKLEDGLATLLEFTAQSILLGIQKCPSIPQAAFVTGGGRHNETLMKRLREICPCPVELVETRKWDGDSVEAQAFAYMAVRSVRALPITFSGTTGVQSAMSGGVLTTPT